MAHNDAQGGSEMDYKELYKEWLENPYFDENTKAELKEIQQDGKRK